MRPKRCSIRFGFHGQVVVDHQVGALEVEALAGGVGGDQDLDVGVLGERLRDLAALVAADAAVDRDDRLGAAEERRGSARRGSSRVSRCSVKMMSLRRSPRRSSGCCRRAASRSSVHFRSVPLCRTRRGQLDQVGEDRELRVELGDRAGGGGRVDELVLELLGLLAGQVVVVEVPRRSGRLGGSLPSRSRRRLARSSSVAELPP